MAFFKFVRKLETEEVITDEKGDSRATYGYTAYGKNDEKDFTGVDKPDPQILDEEPYNVYRFNSKRWDASTGEYDMGFRNYNPGLNRFLTRDMYNGALADMNLGTDPWTMNRYAYAGGNPVSGVGLDGHVPILDPESKDHVGDYVFATGHYYTPKGNGKLAEPETWDKEAKKRTSYLAKQHGGHDPSEALHTFLDLYGLVPVAGEPADDDQWSFVCRRRGHGQCRIVSCGNHPVFRMGSYWRKVWDESLG
ncbi:hypothetical protein HMPREF9374_0404 [Desmospora sp. 8437]|nr:hypothetical protein HMPREF9374_0404 [Desmospora sp. 8437]